MQLFVVPVNSQQNEGDNLLLNPGFEAMFFPWEEEDAVRIADGWSPWWSEDKNHDPQWVRPDYTSAVIEQNENRVRTGGVAQQWSTLHASHYAGMYQIVRDVVPGATYRFSIYTQVWSSTENEPQTQSTLPANPRLHIGIDPLGFENPFSSDIVWSSEALMESVIDRWGVMNVEVVAQAEVITVYMRTNPDFANKHNHIYWDDASLLLVSQPTVTPLPIMTLPIVSTVRLIDVTPTMVPFITVTPELVITQTPVSTNEPVRPTIRPTIVSPTLEPLPLEPSPTVTLRTIRPTTVSLATSVVPTATFVSLPAPKPTATDEPTVEATEVVVLPTQVSLVAEVIETDVPPTQPPEPTNTPEPELTNTPQATATPPIESQQDPPNRSWIYIMGTLLGLFGAGFVWRSRNA